MRSLSSYLLLPRPKDAFKWWIFPLGFLVGALGAGSASGHAVLRAAVVWGVLELFVYQARYQWNDIRGFWSDQQHPESANRGRLPGPAECGRAHIRASRIVMAVRMLLAVLVVVARPDLRVLLPLGLLTLGVFGIAAVYEWLRACGTGRCEEVPAPVTLPIVGIWFVIGGGYAVRGVGGFAMAVSLAGRPALAIAAVCATWAFGTAFVTARWAVEVLAFARVTGDRVVWTARAEQAREHLLALTRWLPEKTDASSAATWRALHEPTCPTALWNTAGAVMGAAAVATGLLLTDVSPWALVALSLLGGTLVAVLAQVRSDARSPIAALCAALLAVSFAAAGVGRPIAALAPWAVLVGALFWFRSHSLESMSGSKPKAQIARTRAHA